MRTAIVSVLLLLALAACDSSTPPGPAAGYTDSPTSATPAVIMKNMRRADDAALSQRHRDMIAAARRHLEQTGGRSIDAYYRVTETDSRYEVFVVYVFGYHPDGQPAFVPGGHCTVLLRDDASVIEVLPGA